MNDFVQDCSTLQQPLEYFLPPEITFATLEPLLAPLGGLEVDPAAETGWRFFDTFDGRLYRGNTVLEELSSGKVLRINLRELGTGRQLAEASGRVPRFAEDFVDFSLRQQLRPLSGIRAFLPLAAGTSRLEPARLLNEDQKTVVRLQLVTPALSPDEADTEPVPLPRRLTILPVRGYGQECQAFLAKLQNIPDVTVAERDLLVDALAADGREPGGYVGKVTLPLLPDEAAHLAVRKILLQLLDTMETNLAGTLANWDTEFLHDFRVAVRRTRSALSQLRGLFPAAMLARFRDEFKWLGSITGPTRDLDVYLLNFPSYQNGLADAYRDDLLPLHEFLLTRQKREQQKLTRALTSPRYQTLVEDWRRFLNDEALAEPVPENALLPIGELAGRRISKVFCKVLKDGGRIDAEAPAEDLHNLRIDCKKLRYLLEFFAGLYPPQQVGRLIRALKKLQDNLGTFQDLSVQSLTLSSFAEEMLAGGKVPVQTLLAMGMLVENLERRREMVRGEFAARFAKFSGERNRTLFKELFTAKGQEMRT